MTQLSHDFRSYQLDDRYEYTRGRVFLTGTQALARVMLDQARRDKSAGLNTAGFVSGYRGSPLGGVDLEFWRSRKRMDAHNIAFMPAVNEDLGATAVLGAQQAILDPHCEVEGVFSMWYGKGPGVDRSGDALKHGNAYGSSEKGGVLVVAGDDHGCVSSSMPHQSDVAFMSWFMPVLNPADVSEFLQFGEYGFALSRYSGTWVGFKAVSETVESARSVELRPDRSFTYPELPDYPGGLHIRRSDLPSPEIETRIHAKLRAVRAFAEANPIDTRIYDLPKAKFGFVTTGKGHLDLMEALRLLGLDQAACKRLGIDIYKVGMVWPLARTEALRFVKGKQEVLVVEEKRGIIESQFKEYFYDWPGDKPERMVGKHDSQGNPLIPWTGELSPLTLVPIIAERLNRFFPEENLLDRADALTAQPPRLLNVPGATRTPYFCSGCPHNTSTKLPEGSKANSGIGCHVMASWMDRDTAGYAQMGGEGVPWTVASKFNGGKHVFQNLGEGTWYHSGSLAIRQAVAANTNITYKILYNDAVAMTGGQPVDGPVSVSGIAQTCRAEGVDRIALVSDNIEKFSKSEFPAGTSFHDRSDMDSVQRELREIPGVTVLIYEQTCATEKRRRRKRGTMEDPKRFAFINDLVCEGCGDCSMESNCLSVEPKETPFGRKRKINLSSCNKDFSCLNGFCPSFVTVEGATRRKKEVAALDASALTADLPPPALPSLKEPFDLLVTGVGGTGVVTVGALITMAAHLEGKGASVLDFTGFAQKFGTVLGYIRLSNTPDALHQVRIDQSAADAVIGCDVVVSSAPKASAHYRAGTKMVLNRAEMPTGDLVLRRDADLMANLREKSISDVIGADNLSGFNANEAAETLLGDAVLANVMMLGFAWQKGLVPVSLGALDQAIVLNGVAIEKNRLALAIGRAFAHDPARLSDLYDETEAPDETLAELIDRRATFLTGYQDVAYAQSYTARLEALRNALPETGSEALVTAAARSLFKLMAYKDEFEVARLLSDESFKHQLEAEFDGDFRVNYHLAPPLLSRKTDARGRPQKVQFGSWMRPALRLLAKGRRMRGSRWNPFGRHEEARLHRDLLIWYQTIIITATERYSPEHHDVWLKVLSAPMDIRGYGPVRMAAAEKVKAEVNTQLETL
ncbi:indolepyruvate ferredoxin oxidoreductase family protein [Phaeobacter gallaeciensis]|uniref:indolepyruvate ferredoxin oxidoreductase family protein n=1 Tax=Phaeobacter gallaeciensis TaxID=60890 RepID=UPI000BBC75D8|nr:indolepyruvate ferredoxin oxidoreductase family protein [Phaeobacter gallaeciensis]ATF19519.1 indolepyruvate oxidoreductase [Phaeobacter gallaeciensis]ATF23628.1 indolepyruvate oxidoreductase [Phaeobacter gallaeciensis]